MREVAFKVVTWSPAPSTISATDLPCSCHHDITLRRSQRSRNTQMCQYKYYPIKLSSLGLRSQQWKNKKRDNTHEEQI